MIVYKITDVSNGKIYIGSTIKPFKTRMQAHLNKGGNTGLCDWFPDINPEKLSGEVIAVIFNPTKEEMSKRTLESYMCLQYRKRGYSLYNKRIDATHHSELSRRKISNSSIGHINTPENIRKFAEWSRTNNIGNTHGVRCKVSFDGKTFLGSEQFYRYLRDCTDYELSQSQTRHFVNEGLLSKAIQRRYPNLLHDVVVERLPKTGSYA
jgi:hypothetical protein